MKRLFDIVVGSVLSLLVLPAVVLLAAAMAITFRAWPFFVQERIGRGGRPFRVLKLRTLPPSAPATADKFEIRQVRVPALAQFLRTHHLDELPQLALVPLGQMSLVGPRPEMTYLHEERDGQFARARVSLRPGCAGLWQVSVDSGLLIWDAPDYDLFYLDHVSLRLDLWILWRTVLNVLGIGGLVTLADVPQWARRTKNAALITRFPAIASPVDGIEQDVVPSPGSLAI